MFEAHFGLRENPFSTSHDPRFVYPSPEHLEAVGHFRYGMQNREAFVLVTGEVGTGKTTAVQDLVSRLPQHAQVALIQNTTLSRPELVEEIARRFNIELEPSISKPALMSRLENALRTRSERGEICLLVVDEAQNLKPDMLEEIRLLSNLELGPGRHFLICLVGQPELEERLARTELRQLRQRISVKYRLMPLDEVECARYAHHRIRVAGGDGERLFPPEAVRTLHAITHGIPRENNIVAGQAMLNAYVEGSPIVRPEHVRQVVDEFSFQSVVSSEPPPAPRPEPAPPPPRQEPYAFPTQSPLVSPTKPPLSTSFPRKGPVQPAQPPAPPVRPPTTPPSVAPPTAPAPVREPIAPAPLRDPAPPPPRPAAVEPVAPSPAAASAPLEPPAPQPAPAARPDAPSPPYVSSTRSVADWRKRPAQEAANAGSSEGAVETMKRGGRRRVPTPILVIVLLGAIVASVMLTGIGRELWGVFFPPAEELAIPQQEPVQEPVTETPPAANVGTAAEAEPVATPGGDWAIQAASFRTQEGAQRGVSILEARTGLKARIVVGQGEWAGWHRVLLGSFADRESAQRKSEELLGEGLVPEDRFPARHPR
jgi:type II secretory pathway predicted ATPase ExeA